MPMDYHSEHEKLWKTSRALGCLWRIGDLGYYLGLILAVISPLAMISQRIQAPQSPLSWGKVLWVSALSIAFWWGIHVGSGWLQYHVIQQGKRLRGER
jgi:hypothetical protein